MFGGEKRKDPRVNSQNLVFYICLDEGDRQVKQGMGRTLNVSEGGILLETHESIEQPGCVILTLGLEEYMMAIKGRMIFSNRRGDGRFETGIQFMEMDDQRRRSLRQYILIFKDEIKGG